MTVQPLLEVRNLSKSFHSRWSGDAKVTKAVDDVSFEIMPGKRLDWSANPVAENPPPVVLCCA